MFHYCHGIPMKSILTICRGNKLLIDWASKWILKSNFVHKLNFTHHSKSNSAVSKVTDVTNAWKLIERDNVHNSSGWLWTRTVKQNMSKQSKLSAWPAVILCQSSWVKYFSVLAVKYRQIVQYHWHLIGKLWIFGGNKICIRMVLKTSEQNDSILENCIIRGWLTTINKIITQSIIFECRNGRKRNIE